MPRPALFVLLGVLGAAGLVWWLLGEESRQPAAPAPRAKGDPARAAPAPVAVDPGTGVPQPEPTAADEPAVPRVLPPDAALEDIRDALAHEDARELAAAFERVGQLAAVSDGSVRGLQVEIPKESDPVVRAVAIAATGARRTPTALGWLCRQLEDPGATGTDRLAALAGLCQPRPDARVAARTVRLERLDGLEVLVGPLGDAEAIGCARLFLRMQPGDEVADVARVLMAAVQSGGVAERILVSQGGALAPYLAEMPTSSWTALRAHMLALADLSSSARGAIESRR